MQTDLKSDDFCGYNQEASPYFWTFQPGQYVERYAMGEVGVFPAGGAAGSYEMPDLVDVGSFLRGLSNNLTKCSPPIPALNSIKNPPLRLQETSTDILLPQYTRELRSSSDLSAIDYNRWTFLPSDAQNLKHVIEDMYAERGGLGTQQYTKLSWDPSREYMNLQNQNNNMCMTVLDPGRLCDGCEEINGYPGTNPITGKTPVVKAIQPSTPPGQPDYPFRDITSQQVNAVNPMLCGPTLFYGKNFDQGSCPQNIPNFVNPNIIQ